jgi:ABC-type dipeptide/oligopeptide/nickel transport system ATPase subunit
VGKETSFVRMSRGVRNFFHEGFFYPILDSAAKRHRPQFCSMVTDIVQPEAHAFLHQFQNCVEQDSNNLKTPLANVEKLVNSMSHRRSRDLTGNKNNGKPFPEGYSMPDTALPILDVKGLKTVFRTRGGEVHAVNSVTSISDPANCSGVVGESGSGKSVTMMSLLEAAAITARRDARWCSDVWRSGPAQDQQRGTAQIRGSKIGFIFQDPMTSLNPVYTVGFQLAEPLRAHMGMNKAQARTRSIELLELVGIPTPSARLKDYPHQFSGGMRQRVMIAIALACDPKVLIADEPTTALGRDHPGADHRTGQGTAPEARHGNHLDHP